MNEPFSMNKTTQPPLSLKATIANNLLRLFARFDFLSACRITNNEPPTRMVQSNVVKTLQRRRKTKYGEDAETFCITSGVLSGLIGEMTKSIMAGSFFC